MVNAILGRNLPIMDFAYHLPKPWTDRFANVNDKQPLILLPVDPRAWLPGPRASCWPLFANQSANEAGEEEEVGSNLHHSEVTDEIGKERNIMLGTNFKVFYSRHMYAGKMALDVTFEANCEKPCPFGGYK